jgi:hypothetical protein
MSQSPALVGIDPHLLKTLIVLGDYLQDVVLVGGWVPHLYRALWPAESPVEPRRTFDLDAAVGGRLRVRHASRLDAVLARRGYECRLGGASGPGVQTYESTARSDLLPIEFLAPLTGPSEEVTVEIQEGVRARALRYLNILLDNTMEVRLSAPAPDAPEGQLTVCIPTPGAYVFHRGLIERGSGGRGRGKDLYYIFETWASLPHQQGLVVSQIRTLRDRYAESWYRRFRSNLESLFASVASEGVFLVFEQYEAREPVDIAHQRIYQAFQALLGSLPQS